MCSYQSNFGLISIVIPLYNEVKNVRPLVMAIDGAMRGFYCEIILINDGSTDGTAAEIQQLNHPKIKLIDLQKNQGQSFALAAGLE
ncbi:MAG: glycosyltransferase, partial [Bacteroidota bacterium]|nr:glycosyltransferase [Bacteroidota bacterium]